MFETNSKIRLEFVVPKPRWFVPRGQRLAIKEYQYFENALKLQI